MDNDKHIRQMFQGLDVDHELDLENKIMAEVDLQKDHSMIINRYRMISKIGLFVSILLAVIVSYIYIRPMFTGTVLASSNQADIIMPYMYSTLTLLAIYIQLEVYHSPKK